MLERSSRRRRLVAIVALLVAAAAAGGSASASRPRPPADDALARAVALQVNAAASVVAEARGTQFQQVSGGSLTVPGILEVRSAESSARTRAGSQARAGTSLGHVRLQASPARTDRLTAEILAGAETGAAGALRAACTLGLGVEAEAVVAATMHGMTLGAAGTPFAAAHLQGSLGAELRAGARAALDGEDLSGPVCARRIDRLVARVVAAVERPVRAALDAHLSVSLTALRTACDLDPRSGSASTEVAVTEGSAGLLGLEGGLDGKGGLVRVAPNTGVDLGGGVNVVLNQQHRSNRPGREAQITVHGLVVRVDQLVVATVASSHCRLWGDVDTGAGSGTGPTEDPEVDAGVGAGVTVTAPTGPASRLASFAAGAYVRATRHF